MVVVVVVMMMMMIMMITTFSGNRKIHTRRERKEDRKEACRCLPVFLFSDICFISSPSTAHVNDQEAPSFGSGGAV